MEPGMPSLAHEEAARQTRGASEGVSVSRWGQGGCGMRSE